MVVDADAEAVNRCADLIVNEPFSTFNAERTGGKVTASARSLVLEEETTAVAVPFPARNTIIRTPHVAGINVVHGRALFEKH